MKKRNDTYEIDMCQGPIFGKLILFALPLMASNLLQLLFNAADVIVVGNFAGSLALAAVGSTGSVINLLIATCMGLSVGISVAMANRYGSGDIRGLNNCLHTSMALSLIFGVVMAGIGIGLARPLLSLMNTPDDVIDQAVLYMRIYFAGMPVIFIYNFGSAALRAVGDTRRPLIYLSIAGILNVVLNLFFVIVMGMAAGGVALATIISQCVSAVLVVICLMRSSGSLHLEIRKIAIDKNELGSILRVGLPAGLQSFVFDVSNVIIQAAINSFGAMAVAGNSAAANLESFLGMALNAFSVGAMTFAGQNMGAKLYKRLTKVTICAAAIITVIAGVGGNLVNYFSGSLISIYTKDAEAIAFGQQRTAIMLTLYFSCGFMDLFSNMQRGMGYSLTPMLVTMVGVVGVRLVWIATVFAHYHTPFSLYIAYPISWSANAIMQFTMFALRKRKLIRSLSE